MRFKIMGALMALMMITACTNVWRANKTTVDMAYGARSGWADYYVQEVQGATPARLAELNKQKAQVDESAKKLAMSAKLVADLTSSYETNTTLKAQLDATRITVNDNAANLVYLTDSFRKAKKTK